MEVLKVSLEGFLFADTSSERRYYLAVNYSSVVMKCAKGMQKIQFVHVCSLCVCVCMKCVCFCNFQKLRT